MPRRSRKAEAVVRVSARGGPFRGIDARTLGRRARKMLRALELDGVELSVALVDDATMRGLNDRYRGIDKPTDVLAFPMDEGDGMLGDVILAVEVARRQAAAHRCSLGDELTMLMAHGLLHLLGHDHGTRAEERAMKARTDELVAAARARA